MVADKCCALPKGAGNSDADTRGIWCTNCHTQLSQEIWRTEDCNDLVHSDPTQTSSPDCLVNPRAQPTLEAVAQAVGLTEQQAINYLDPKNPNTQPPGVPQVTVNNTHAAWNPAIPDANVATIEVAAAGSPGNCAPLTPSFNAAFGVNVCVSLDADGDPSVNVLSFCTTDDCVAQINDPANRTQPGSWRYPEAGTVDHVSGFAGTGTFGAAVPFSAADDARDHWLAAGEPHCADCHAAPYVEQSGNITAYPPFNYPAKASLMRYTRGHQNISCQGCHESIHGLYPVGAAIDNTSYAQAAALNGDGSHGPVKCGGCHQVDQDGVPFWINGAGNWGGQYVRNFDEAVGFAHTYTDEANVLNSTCQNCHGPKGDPAWSDISATEDEYLTHAYAASSSLVARTSRLMMDKAETAQLGHVLGASAGTERDQLCSTCHSGNTNRLGTVTCSTGWKQHLTQGRVSESVWEDVTENEPGVFTPLCGW